MRKHSLTKAFGYSMLDGNAEVAELVDALDSGSSGEQSLWGFKSPLRHQIVLDRKIHPNLTFNNARELPL
jgi:hypothetical protein